MHLDVCLVAASQVVLGLTKLYAFDSSSLYTCHHVFHLRPALRILAIFVANPWCDTKDL